MKKLIYFTLGNNLQYLNIAKLCVLSLQKFNYNGDFLFITNIKDLIIENIKFNNNVYFMEVPVDGLFSSSANKLKLYNFERVNEYDKIIFSDLDILFTNNPDIIFDEIIEDKFYVSNESELMSAEWWGARLLDQIEKNKINENNIMGINAGFFAFNKNMVNHLEKIEHFLKNNISLSNECLEQPFFNVYLHRNSLYDNKLTKYVSHSGYSLDSFNGVVLHFAGGPGNYEIKYRKMIEFYNKNII
jgi:hypothetical protein